MEPEVERMKQILFWRYQYHSRAAALNPIDDWGEVMRHVLLWEDPELGDETLRFVANAMLSKIGTGKCSYDLGRIPLDLVEWFEKYSLLSTLFGYYLEDIIVALNSKTLLLDIVNNSCSFSPPSLLYANDIFDNFSIKLLTNWFHQGKFYSVDHTGQTKDADRIADDKFQNHLDKLMVSIRRLENMPSDEKEKKAKLILAISDIAQKWPTRDVTIQEDEINSFAMAYNSVVAAKFRMKSNASRAKGLFMWDRKYLEGKPAHIALAALRECARSDEQGNPTDEQLFGWRKRTDDCIKSKKVLKI